MQRRRLPLVLAAVALLATLLWIATRTGHAPAAPVATPRADGASPAPHGLGRPRKRTVAPRPDAAPDPAAGSAAASDEPDGAPLFPPLEVEVRLADGTWPDDAGGFAYALRPGDSGAGGPLVREDLRPDGTCTLFLSKPGVYGIGAVGAGVFVWTLATDVDTRTTSLVSLTMPPTAEVRFVAAPEGAPLQGRMDVVADMNAPAAETPGRGAVLSASAQVRLGGLPVTMRARTDVRLRARHGIDPSVSTPERFAAPAVVTVARPRWGHFRLLVSVEPADRAAEHDSWISYRFECEGGGRVERWDGGLDGLWDVPAGRRVSDVIRFEFSQSPPAAHSILRWTGAGVLPGSLAIDVPESGSVDVPVVLRLDDPRSFPRSEFSVRVDGPADATRLECWIVGDDGALDANLDVAALGRDQVLPFPAGWTQTSVMAAARGLVSQPMRLTVGARHEFVLRRTGLLRIARGVRPPEGVTLVLRREDRLPLLMGTDGDGRFRAAVAVDLDAPAVDVGPLPEGDVALVVSWQDQEVAQFTAHVVADETTYVRLPLADRLPRR